MIAFTGAELEAIGKVQRRLLSPPADLDGIDDWRHRVNRDLTRAAGADAALFQLPLEGVPLLYSAELDPDRIRAYRSHMEELDEEVDYTDRMARIGVGIRKTLWDGRMRWFYRSAYYNEIIRPARAFDPVWAAVAVPGASRPAVLHAYHDSRSGVRFGEHGLALMRLLRPALESAVHTLQRFRDRRASLLRVVDRLPDPVFLVDRRGRTVHRNPAADRLHRDEPTKGTLADGIASAARSVFGPFRDAPTDAVGVVIRARIRGGTVRIRASLLDEKELGCGGLALVTAQRMGWMPPERHDLQERFGFTPRQAEVAQLLARRATNKEIAAALGISCSTARRHTEDVLGKLGIHSRRRVRERIRPPLSTSPGADGR